jgi:hypothetical protein
MWCCNSWAYPTDCDFHLSRDRESTSFTGHIDTWDYNHGEFFPVAFISMLLTCTFQGLGTGGFKACVGYVFGSLHMHALSNNWIYSTFMTEQTVDPRPKIKVLKNGERVIIDNDLTVTRSYMYFYLFLNVGAIVGETGMCIHYSLSLKIRC